MVMFFLLFILFSTLFFNVTPESPDSIKKPHINCIRKLFDNFHAVEPGVLYRSKQLSKKRLEKYIKRLHLKTIINLRGPNPTMPWWQKEKALAKKYDIKFYSLAMTAHNMPLKKHLLELLHIYETAPKPILIHCYSGADRTGEAAALWVLEQQKKQKKTALKQLSFKYGYLRSKNPAKHLFISIWQGKNWLKATYDPRLYSSNNNALPDINVSLSQH